MKCECVTCSECGGKGHVWFSFPGPPTGRYLGNSRSDDLDEMEMCDQCQGSGVSETCYACAEAIQEEYERYDYDEI